MERQEGEEMEMLEEGGTWDDDDTVMDGSALGAVGETPRGGASSVPAYRIESGDVSLLEAWAACCSPSALESDMRKNWRKRLVYVGILAFFVLLIIGAYGLAVVLDFGTGIEESSEGGGESMMTDMMGMADDADQPDDGDHARTLDCGDVDSDGDGVGDGCDMCPHDPLKLFPGQCGCGVKDIDSDGDGLMDCRDECPDDPNKIKPGELGCGAGEVAAPAVPEEGSAPPTHLSPYEEHSFALDTLRWRWMRVFPDFISSVLDQPPLDPRRSLPGADLRMWKSCWNDDDLFRMTTDPICTAMWMRRLMHVPTQVLDVQHLSSVGSTQFTSVIKLALPTDEMPVVSAFRPCVSEGIDFERNFTYANEINAFLIDRILGFNRHPAVVPRTFSRSELDDSNVSQYFSQCGDAHGNLEGAMVGWLPYHTSRITKSSDKKKYPYFLDLSEEDVDELVQDMFAGITRASPEAEVADAMEAVTVNMWLFLTGADSYRYEHGLVRAKGDGHSAQHLTVLKSHAAQLFWNSTKEQADVFKQVCKFPEEVARRVLILSPQRTHHVVHEYREQSAGRVTLGGLVRGALQKFGRESFLPPRQLDVLDINVRRLADAILECMAEHGAESVLIPERRAVERDFKYFQSSLDMYSHQPSSAHEMMHDDDEY